MKRRIRGLTLHTPWPWAILHLPSNLAKRVENRTFPAPGWMRGQYLALHAGKTWDYKGAERIKSVFPAMPGSQSEHPLGIVGVARIGRVFGDVADSAVGITSRDELPPSQERWYFGGECVAWELFDVVTFEKAVPCRGMQGLWSLDEPTLDAVRVAFDHARGKRDSAESFETARP